MSIIFVQGLHFTYQCPSEVRMDVGQDPTQFISISLGLIVSWMLALARYIKYNANYVYYPHPVWSLAL